jgi:rfaE bifunctional protein nucleotidyltransferase chain/domain
MKNSLQDTDHGRQSTSRAQKKGKLKKVLSIKNAARLSKRLQQQGKRIVLAGGCFDILHIGHLHFLQNAKKRGDTLFVMLESDASIKKLKGKDRPINTQRIRAEILAALSTVDAVILLPQLQSNDAYDSVILQLKPAIIATTIGDPNRSHKLRQAKLVDGQLVSVIGKVADASTTRLASLLSKEL